MKKFEFGENAAWGWGFEKAPSLQSIREDLRAPLEARCPHRANFSQLHAREVNVSRLNQDP